MGLAELYGHVVYITTVSLVGIPWLSAAWLLAILKNHGSYSPLSRSTCSNYMWAVSLFSKDFASQNLLLAADLHHPCSFRMSSSPHPHWKCQIQTQILKINIYFDWNQKLCEVLSVKNLLQFRIKKRFGFSAEW